MKKLLFILLGFISLNAFSADPTYDATKGALQNNSALCGYGYNKNCNQGNSYTHPQKIIQHIKVNVPSKYGAVAVSTSKSYIDSAENASSKAEAERIAKHHCESGSGSSCKVIFWYANGCAATADGVKRGKHQAFAQAAENRTDAEKAALRKCSRYGAFNCKIVMPAQCSLP